MKKTFEDAINEWTDTVVKENRTSDNPAALLVIMRLGALGQRLIYEAYQRGQESVINRLQEVREAEPKTGTLHGLPTN